VLILALIGLTLWRGRRVRRALEAAEARLGRNQGN
ncbi:heme exporter protein CcmD, partial [Thioclava sp. BHET1]